MLLVDMVRLDERRLLGLDDPVAGLNALRSAREKGRCQLGPSSLDVSVVEEYTYGLAGVLGPVLDFLSCACGILTIPALGLPGLFEKILGVARAASGFGGRKGSRLNGRAKGGAKAEKSSRLLRSRPHDWQPQKQLVVRPSSLYYRYYSKLSAFTREP